MEKVGYALTDGEKFVEEEFADGAYFYLVPIDEATIYSKRVQATDAMKEALIDSGIAKLDIVQVKRTISTVVVK